MVRNLPASGEDPRDLALIPGLPTSPDVGNGSLFHFSCMESFTDRGAWQAMVCGVVKSQT